MNEMIPSSAEPQHQHYQLKANETVTIHLSAESVEIQALPAGGCEVKVTVREKIPAQHKLTWFSSWFGRFHQVWINYASHKPGQIPPWIPWLLTLGCLILYLSTRLIGLRDYPIYFFSDEAVQTVLAEDLVRGGYSDPHGHFLPAFFYNGYQYNLGTSVYLQVIPYLIFGRSLEVNRAASVLATSFSAIFLFLIGRQIFRLKYPWNLILLLSITPVWFLHSRTSFETGLAFTFYSGFLYFYLRYRDGDLRCLYAAALMASLAFYTYSPMRFVVLGNAVFFFLLDLKYHFQHKEVFWRALGLIVVLGLPYIRFEVQHPGEMINHLRILGSYWVQELTLLEKLGRYFKEYFLSFSPRYWFLPHTEELGRHRMAPYGFIPIWLLPFIMGGMILAIRRWSDHRYRFLFFVCLLAPIGGAVVARGITRILVMVIPLLIFGGLFLDELLDKIQQRFRISSVILSLSLFTVLAWMNINLLMDALKNGPLWDQDYSMSGMQYGAVQMAEKIPAFLASQTDPVHLVVTPTWANGTDVIMRFFFGTPVPFEMGNIDTYINQYVPLDEDLVLVMTPEEMDHMYESGKFADVRIVDHILYPNGQRGFYFVKLRYKEGIEAVFAAEAAARKVLQVDELAINGVPSTIAYSYLDIGSIDKIFDRDLGTLIRTMEANPMEIRITYARPLNLEACTAHIGGTASELKLGLHGIDGSLLGEYQLEVADTPYPRTLDFEIMPQNQVQEVHFLLKNSEDGEPAHVHLWEFTCIRQAD